MNMQSNFSWQSFPPAERYLRGLLDAFKEKSQAITDFESRLITQTSTRLLDWLDHILLPENDGQKELLAEKGFLPEAQTDLPLYSLQGARFPKIVLTGSNSEHATGIALRVENVDDFFHVHNSNAEIQGEPFSKYRQGLVDCSSDISFLAVERRSWECFTPEKKHNSKANKYREALACWQSYARDGLDSVGDEQVFSVLTASAERIVSLVGSDLAAHLVLESERDYWLSRNHTARVQKNRQDALGLGWANHDHHTFRSSRHNFSYLIRLFKTLGFFERERFYAGKDAGWGAQVMEHPAGLVLFLDVDLEPKEISIDFVNQELPKKDRLGTVGLWCALHGDSILKAGMHHLAVNALFERLNHDIEPEGVSFMTPFSNMHHLKQAFSKPEMWVVDPDRLKSLKAENQISSEKADKFFDEGAVGSHLENIQRRDGFKGFSQTRVSNIIRRLDPRKVS